MFRELPCEKGGEVDLLDNKSQARRGILHAQAQRPLHTLCERLHDLQHRPLADVVQLQRTQLREAVILEHHGEVFQLLLLRLAVQTDAVQIRTEVDRGKPPRAGRQGDIVVRYSNQLVEVLVHRLQAQLRLRVQVGNHLHHRRAVKGGKPDRTSRAVLRIHCAQTRLETIHAFIVEFLDLVPQIPLILHLRDFLHIGVTYISKRSDHPLSSEQSLIPFVIPMFDRTASIFL